VSTVIERLENGELCLRLNELVGPKQGDYQYYEVMMKLEAELLRLAKLGTEITPDKVVIHKDELDRMKQNMAEKDRQTEEAYTVLKYEQDRANRAVGLLKRINGSLIFYQQHCPICKAKGKNNQFNHAKQNEDGSITFGILSLEHTTDCELAKLITKPKQVSDDTYFDRVEKQL
jgi:hypothetical protein